MANRFTPGFRSVADRGRSAIMPIAELGFPGGTWFVDEIGLDVNGQTCEDRVAEGGWGDIPWGNDNRNARLESLQTTIRLKDMDRRFAKLVEGPLGELVDGSPATIRFVMTDDGSIYSDAFTPFVGIVTSGWSFDGDLYATLKLRTNDLPLERNAPKIPLSPYFPNAKAEAIAGYAPLIYGVHDATGLSGVKGMVPGIHTDTVSHRYTFSGGRLKTFRRVFSGEGAPKVLGVDYVVEYREVDGVLWSEVRFFTSQGNNVVSADVDGIETVGDGTGTVITNEILQLQHWLVNFVWGDYRNGLWLPVSSAPIDVTTFAAAAAFLDKIGKTGSRRFSGEAVLPRDVINDFADELGARFWWNNLSKLCVRIDDPRVSPIYVDEPWFREGNGIELGGFGTDNDDQGLIDRVIARHCYFETNDDFSQSLEVRDTAVNRAAPKNLDMRWSPSHIV